MEGDGLLLAEKENEKEAKRAQKKVKPAVEPKANPAPGAITTSAAGAGSPEKRSKKAIKEKAKARTGDNFLRNEPSPDAAIRDVIGTVGSGVIPGDTVKIITKLLSDRCPRGGERDVVAARECSGGGVETVEHQDVATLRPTKWLNDNIVNFVGKVVIQPQRGHDATKVHVFSSHLMDKLLGGADQKSSTSVWL